MRSFVFSIIFSLLFCITTYDSSSAAATDDLKCESSSLPWIDKQYRSASGTELNYNRDLVSAAYGVFAAASDDAYRNSQNQFFFGIAEPISNSGWKYLNWTKTDKIEGRYQNDTTGMVVDTYYKLSEKCVHVLLAFRGTNFESFKDWYSNFAPVTAILPFQNQYRVSDTIVPKIIKFSEEKFGPKKVHYIATGHSLGGGLAQHVAKCFDNFSAVAFDSSFVDQSLKCRNRKSQIIRVYEEYEPFQRLSDFKEIIVRSKGNIGQNRKYELNKIELKRTESVRQHSMLGLAAGMLRLSLDCKINRAQECEIKTEGPTIKTSYFYNLYCKRLVKTPFEISNFSVSSTRYAVKLRSDELCI